MASEPVTLRTEAEAHLLASYDLVRDKLPGSAKVRHHRATAIESFRNTGLPHRRVEAWHYTDLRALLRSVPPIGRDSNEEAVRRMLAEDSLGKLDHARIVIADGGYRPDLSDAQGLPGIEVVSLADALQQGDPRIGSLFNDDIEATVALNSALMAGGVVVRVAPGASVARPIRIAHLQTGSEPAAVYVRNVVDVGAAARVSLWESHSGVPGVGHHANIVSEWLVGGRATVKAARLQASDARAVHIVSLFVAVADDAIFEQASLATGSAIARAQTFVKLAGEGARASLSGATLLDGERRSDTAIVIEHLKPATTSRVLFRSAVDGRGEGAFQGKVIVAEGAQKADGKLGSKALLLSDDASFSAKPELEIYADDVQCGHGSTTGKIDTDHLFYLLSRGIPRAEAEQLLIAGFLAEAVEAIDDRGLIAALQPSVESWLAGRGQGKG
ncbi:MAG: Fe-S cluster assembly protein SufD [Bauldia sp.]